MSARESDRDRRALREMIRLVRLGELLTFFERAGARPGTPRGAVARRPGAGCSTLRAAGERAQPAHPARRLAGAVAISLPAREEPFGREPSGKGRRLVARLSVGSRLLEGRVEARMIDLHAGSTANGDLGVLVSGDRERRARAGQPRRANARSVTGTGCPVEESAHRTIPQRRLKLPGAWSRIDTIDEMLGLRVLRANG